EMLSVATRSMAGVGRAVSRGRRGRYKCVLRDEAASLEADIDLTEPGEKPNEPEVLTLCRVPIDRRSGFRIRDDRRVVRQLHELRRCAVAGLPIRVSAVAAGVVDQHDASFVADWRDHTL